VLHEAGIVVGMQIEGRMTQSGEHGVVVKRGSAIVTVDMAVVVRVVMEAASVSVEPLWLCLLHQTQRGRSESESAI
jgi:hypothetical protein